MNLIKINQKMHLRVYAGNDSAVKRNEAVVIDLPGKLYILKLMANFNIVANIYSKSICKVP